MHDPARLPMRVPRVRPAWPPRRARAAPPLGLWPALVHCQPDLLARVAVSTAQLQTLPRRVRRVLQRQWRGPLIGMALVLALGQRPGLAATIPVSDTCTLVDAITAANTDRARGGCPAGSGADTIVLPPGSTQTLTAVHNDTYGPTGLPVIRSVVTIAGQGSTITRDSGAPEFRIVAVNGTGDLTLQETTVSGGVAESSGEQGPGRGGGVFNYGTLTLIHSTLARNHAGGYGGGIWSNGTVTVTHSTLSDNTAASNGGGIWHQVGTLTLTHSTISGNEASGHGGGVYNNDSGTLTVTHSTLSDNTASFDGGGLLNGGTVTVTHSTLTGNVAAFGGGLLNRSSGTVTVTNSTHAGNTASDGGGISNNGPLTVTNSTLAGNTAARSGGGVANTYGGTLLLMHTTLTGNAAEDGGAA
jgi:Chlamydia polymorphic membrane protein (Chlamydia_PMP) repeat